MTSSRATSEVQEVGESLAARSLLKEGIWYEAVTITVEAVFHHHPELALGYHT